MDRKPLNNESPLLLKLPKSMLSFSDMSGNSFLMPVAVDNVVATESSGPNATTTSNLTDSTPVCQLQQPLLMRRGSTGPKMAVPYSESNAQTHVATESTQAGVSYSRSPLQPSTSNVEISSQSTETNWSASSTVEHPQHSNTVLSGFPNQPPTSKPEFICQSNPFPPTTFNPESMGTDYQNVYPQEPPVPPVSSYSSDNRYFSPAFPVTSGQPSEFLNVTSSVGYSSEPLVMPTATSLFQSNSGRDASHIPPAPFSNPTLQSLAQNSSIRVPESYSRIYEPANPYWLFLEIVETKEVWYGFSEIDSSNLEIAFQQDPNAVVPVDGGRYDALLSERIKRPVYFEGKDLQICRGTWFYRRGTSQRYIPFPENTADTLEKHYASCVTSGQWQKRVPVPGIGTVVMESPQSLLYYKNDVEIWPSLPDSKTYPQPVRRGLPENFEIMEDQNDRIDHLVFIVQGIGSFCDLRFRTVAECVDGFREIASKLMAIHFKNELESGRVGRVEFLPLAWHAKLHTSDKGFDRCMRNITLPSIPKLRHFTNDTLLDILLYSSPTYCQTIIDTVASELNKLYEIFLSRNPEFSGSVFVAGHSLGSLILFDILGNQGPNVDQGNLSNEPIDILSFDNQESKSLVESTSSSKASCENKIEENSESTVECQLEGHKELLEEEKAFDGADDISGLLASSSFPSASTAPQNPAKSEVEVLDVSDEPSSLGFPGKTSPCMSSIKYPKLRFEPACFFALGSPISMFLTVRGYEYISDDFRFPTCPRFFHIFHPYDPVAFRIEPLIDPTFSAKPVLIPHHKGRKRMHLEIRENLAKVGSEIKQKVLDTLQYTWDSLSIFAKAHSFSSVEAEIDKLMQKQITEAEYEAPAPSETSGEEIQIGSLNGGRRIDYVLQEKPIEALNDYIFALTSHATYWDSEDTVLMILREIYATQGILVSSPSEIKYSPSEKTVHNSYAKLNSVMSDPSLYQSSQVDQQSLGLSNTLNSGNNSKASRKIFRDSVESYHEAAKSPAAFQASNNVPPYSMSAQSFRPMPATFSQPVEASAVSASQSPHVLNPSLSQPAGLPPASTAQPAGLPPASTAQPVGPPPLTGFVKRSPFAR